MCSTEKSQTYSKGGDSMSENYIFSSSSESIRHLGNYPLLRMTTERCVYSVSRNLCYFRILSRVQPVLTRQYVETLVYALVSYLGGIIQLLTCWPLLNLLNSFLPSTQFLGRSYRLSPSPHIFICADESFICFSSGIISSSMSC